METTIKLSKQKLDTLHSCSGRIMQIGRRLKRYEFLCPGDADLIFQLGEQLEDFFNDQQPITKMMKQNQLKPSG